MLRSILNMLALVLIGVRGGTVENFPPPEFTSAYQYPREFWPAARAELFLVLDIVVLCAALVTAAVFIHKKRSPRDLFVLALFAVAYFGFFRRGCICPVGSVQNVAMAIGQPEYMLPLSVGLLFLLPLMFALFFGRIFCSSVCPLGAVQELVLLRPTKMPRALSHALSVIPYIVLGVALFSAVTGGIFYVCKFDPFVPIFRLNGPLYILITSGIVLALSLVIGRPYCRFFCPYGVLLRWLAPFARWRMQITRDKCVECHLCADACPYDAIRTPSTPAPGDEKRTFLLAILALPCLMVLGGLGGYAAKDFYLRQHPTIRNAETVWKVEKEENQSATLDAASPNIPLYQRAIVVQRRTGTAAWFLGGWIGLVIGGKIISLTTRRKRSEYSIDQASCYACGRCYRSCPTEEANERMTAIVDIGGDQ